MKKRRGAPRGLTGAPRTETGRTKAAGRDEPFDLKASALWERRRIHADVEKAGPSVATLGPLGAGRRGPMIAERRIDGIGAWPASESPA